MDRRELRQYEEWKQEVQFLRGEHQHLRLELMACRPALYRADQRVADLEERVAKLEAENRQLRRRVKELTAAAATPPRGGAPAPPPFVKPSARGRRKKPGRKAGHPAALRPVPAMIDVHQDVPLPRDDAGRPACPRCNCSLSDVKRHERLVEDLVPAKVIVTCYHTASGYCAMCRKRVESRASEQPPAANLPHGQLGINALATAAVLRVVHRLPFGQVVRVLADLPGLSVSAGGIAKQLQRLGEWLDPYYERVKLALRVAPHVNGDETGWRTNGRNGYLWTVTDPKQGHTLYHVDKSRSGKVIEGLLGRTFAGTLGCDFYSAYGRLGCPKQRCLAHLLRELKDTARDRPAFAACTFHRRAVRLMKDMLALKRKWDELSDACYTRRARPHRGPARSAGTRALRRAGRGAAGQALAQAPRGADAVPVGQATGRHQQHRRAGPAPGGGHAQDHRRQPQRQRCRGVGQAREPDAHRQPAGPQRAGDRQATADRALGRETRDGTHRRSLSR